MTEEIRRSGALAVTSTLVLGSNRITGLLAGEDLAAGDACYVDLNDRAYRAIAAVPGAAADVRGFALADTLAGADLTLAFDVNMRYGEALSGSTSLYLSGAVPGGLSNAPSAGGKSAVAYVVSDTEIHLLQSSQTD